MKDVFKALTCCGAVAATCLAANAFAQDTFPAKPIRLIVPLPPGGGADGLARIWGDFVARHLGATVVVENRAGANGSIAAAYVATQPADGYTILLATQSNLALNRFSYGKLNYDPDQSFAGVGILATTPQVLLANNAVPANNIADLIRLAKASPGKYSYSTAGKGNSTHLNMEIFARHVGVDLLNVPYKGSAAALLAVVGGETQLTSAVVFSAIPFIKEKKVKPLVVFADKRVPEMPDVPTQAEIGIPKSLGGGWYGLVAPKGTPGAIIQKLNAATTKMWADPESRQKLGRIYMAEPADKTASAVAKSTRQDAEQWGPLVKSLNLAAQ
ncbi:tripartite tricarboxylate transporter substrate binding protein [Cupriavidus sp. BIC8F]|uniref:Bug family tripartite tricarboxylate transporter substrate binding protein n=1 Tax=Cupriavidus sp. BIC8F TaxID=3079014 RepID=UPI0029163F0F|nr:tripartite tricarboxylate transporter substrate binding protein [Cupriavidus sp. BIC8F]